MNALDRVQAKHTGRIGTVVAFNFNTDEAHVKFDESPNVISIIGSAYLTNLTRLGIQPTCPVVAVSQPTPPPEGKCSHKWVNYQPLQGESYWCCANAGCGIRFVDTLPKEEYPLMTEEESAWLFGQPASVLPTGIKKTTVDNTQKVTQQKIIKPGWTPVTMADYLDATKYMTWSKK